jgi:hypothetical protein
LADDEIESQDFPAVVRTRSVENGDADAPQIFETGGLDLSPPREAARERSAHALAQRL